MHTRGHFTVATCHHLVSLAQSHIKLKCCSCFTIMKSFLVLSCSTYNSLKETSPFLKLLQKDSICSLFYLQDTRFFDLSAFAVVNPILRCCCAQSSLNWDRTYPTGMQLCRIRSAFLFSCKKWLNTKGIHGITAVGRITIASATKAKYLELEGRNIKNHQLIKRSGQCFCRQWHCNNCHVSGQKFFILQATLTLWVQITLFCLEGSNSRIALLQWSC